MRDRGRDILMRTLPKAGAWNLETAIYNYAIEQATHEGFPRYWENKDFRGLYASKLRSIAFNLSDPRNPSLLEKVRNGSIPFTKLVRMTPIELFPDNWEQELNKVAQKYIRREMAMSDVPDGAFQCRKCKSWKTIYYQMQTRSADEPMTTFVTCANCAAHWKF